MAEHNHSLSLEDINLFRALQGKGKENLFFSPVSIKIAFAIAYAGAAGKTAEEIAVVLGFPGQATHDEYGRLLSNLRRQVDGCTLAIANKLFGYRGYAWEGEFLRICRDNYGAPLQEMDFPGKEAEVNAWVAGETNGLITDLIPPSTFGPSTRLVLVNAIYFKGEWTHSFSPQLTKPSTFTLLNGKAVSVPKMGMAVAQSLTVAETKEFEAVVLPYGPGEGCHMVVVLPKNKGKDALTSLDLTQVPLALGRNSESTKVMVKLPKFKIEGQVPVKDQLVNLGMNAAFDGDVAEFTKMCTKEPLVISEVFHNAYINVNEEGTEAAASTAVVMGRGGRRPPPVRVFDVDRPFAFYIADSGTGATLFMGQCVDPRS